MTNVPNTPPTGFKYKKVGEFLIGSRIDDGSHTEIRLGVHVGTSDKVAIKVVPKRTLVQEGSDQRHFRREALLLQRLLHPNIVRLYWTLETCNSYYLVMELVPGKNLLERLSDCGRLCEDESRHYLRQVVSAVDHLHQSHIVHRNLMLDNILLDERNNIKLIGFGFSSVCRDNDRQLSTLCASPLYAAPELFSGRKYGKPVDIWSLGVCMFAMVVGYLPFLPGDESSMFELRQVILKGCHPPEYLSSECRNLLSRLLEQDDNLRVTANVVVSHSWLASSDGHPVKRFPAVSKNLQGHSVEESARDRLRGSDVLTHGLHQILTSSSGSPSISKVCMETGNCLTSKENVRMERSILPIESSVRLPILGRGLAGVGDPVKTFSSQSSQNSFSYDSSASVGTPSVDSSRSASSFKSVIARLNHFRHQLIQARDSAQTFHNSNCSVLGRNPTDKHLPDSLTSLRIRHPADSSRPECMKEPWAPSCRAISSLKTSNQDIRMNTSHCWKIWGPDDQNDLTSHETFDLEDVTSFDKDQYNTLGLCSKSLHSSKTISHTLHRQKILADPLSQEMSTLPHQNSSLQPRKPKLTRTCIPLSLSRDSSEKCRNSSNTISHMKLVNESLMKHSLSRPQSDIEPPATPTTLPILRDPFGRDFWDQKSPERQSRETKSRDMAVQRARRSQLRDHRWILRNASGHLSLTGSRSWIDKKQGQGSETVNSVDPDLDNKKCCQFPGRLVPADEHGSHRNRSVASLTKMADTLSRRSEMDSPESPQPDLEEILLPVTRVVIIPADSRS